MSCEKSRCGHASPDSPGPPSEDAPKRNVAQRLPPTAPAVVCIYKAQLTALRFCLRPPKGQTNRSPTGRVMSGRTSNPRTQRYTKFR